jgi:hypothetical protein
MKFIKEYKLNDLSICDRLIDLFHVADEKELTYAGRVGGGSIVPEIKKSKDFFIEEAAPCGSAKDYKFDLYKNQVDSFIKEYLQSLKIDNLSFVAKQLPQIQYYKPGDGFYTWHVDASGLEGCDRAFVYITYLNDVPDGGTEFYYQDYTVKAEKGKTVIFPAGLTHKHRGQISETQEKYIITGWIWWT